MDSKKQKSFFRTITNVNKRTQTGEWTIYEGAEEQVGEEPLFIYQVSVKNTTLFVGDQMFLFNRPGFCWDGENKLGQYKACVDSILPTASFADKTFDSVFVYTLKYALSADSISHRFYISAPLKVRLQHEIVSGNQVDILEKLILVEQE
jgi:sodium-dependent phosphate cotransporter